MNRTLKSILVAACTCLFLHQALAQKANKTATKEKTKLTTIKRVTEVNATLGTSGQNNGSMSKTDFDKYMKQGVTAERNGKVEGFMFNYSERNYYEDSIGNPIRVMEYFSEYCVGNMLSEAVNSTIYDRTKPGDTVYIDKIKVQMPDGSEGRGKSMWFALTK